MSRVILSRHPNGAERVVVGYDRPMATYFAHEYDAEEECVRAAEAGYRAGGIPTPPLLVDEAGGAGIEIDLTPDLAEVLEAHRALDYPASNVVVDLSAHEPPADVKRLMPDPTIPLCPACVDAYRNGIEPGGTACEERGHR